MSTSVKNCRFYGCGDTFTAERGNAMCPIHMNALSTGLINLCPECKQYYKKSSYNICLDCYNKKRGKLAKSQQQDEKFGWESHAVGVAEFYVYILKLNQGKFYVGQTRALRARMMEHRDGTTMSTTAQNPKLVWFTVLPTRTRALETEAEIKKLVASNPRKIREMVIDFSDIARELDYS